MKNYLSLLVLLLAIILLVNIFCKKEINGNGQQFRSATSQTDNSKSLRRVEVSNVDELYSAVNDPDNASTILLLEAGTYVLNAAYPNGGRLELQPDMLLQGQPGNRDEVIIDASLLPGTSF